MLKRKLQTALTLAGFDRAALARRLLGHYRLYYVFVADLEAVAPAGPPSSAELRQLSETDLRALVSRRPQLQYQVDQLEAVGASGAYGMYRGGELAHVIWLMTAEEDEKLLVRLVKLRPGEAEITHAFTFPEFRGRSLYPLAIRGLCGISKGRGLKRVFMITRRANVASQRGIEKAGFRRKGWILRIAPPLFHSGRGWILRGFRLVLR